MVKCVILGCGGSNGVPEVACDCYVCSSDNPKNRRTRTSLLIQHNAQNILIDTGPDLRQQLLSNQIAKIDAVLYTHTHADHINGIDDLKLLAKSKVIPAYMDQKSYDVLMRNFEYIFVGSKDGLYKASLCANIIPQYHTFEIGDLKIQSFLQYHHAVQSLGFRFSDIAYCTDFSSWPEESMKFLHGLEILIVSCLRYAWAPSHPFLNKLLKYVHILKPKKVVLVHMSHGIEYEEIRRLLPDFISPAYDGMRLELSL